MIPNDYIEIHITGLKGTDSISPLTYDICELKEMLDIVCGLMNHTSKSNEVVSCEIKDGSVRQIYHSTKKEIAIVCTFLGLAAGNYHLVDIDDKLATQIELMQVNAEKKGYTYDIKNSSDVSILKITPKTQYRRLSAKWVDADYYLYGVVMKVGGSTDSTIALRIKNETLTISVDKNKIESLNKNIVYHECGIYVRGKQNVETFEMDKQSLTLVSFIDYTSLYDDEYLKSCIAKATPAWSNVNDPAEWLHEIRGYE